MKLLPILCFIISTVSQLYGQIPLIETEDDGFSSLTPLQVSRYNTIVEYLPGRDTTIISEEIVKINPMSEANEEGYFTIKINGSCLEETFLINHIEYYDDKSFFAWSESESMVEDSEQPNQCDGSSLFLMADEGVFYGELNYKSGFYKLINLGEGTCLLIGLKPNVPGICGVTDENFGLNSLLNDQSVNTLSSNNSDNNCIINVLFAYTDEIKYYVQTILGFRSIVPYVDSKVGYFNYVEKRSSHNGSYAQIRRVMAIPRLSIEGSQFKNDKDLLTAFHSKIQSYSYDLAHLLCSSSTGSGSLGAAYSGRNNGDPAPYGYNIGFSTVTLYGSEKITIHEIGHNLGADHENETDGNNRGKNFTYKTWFLGTKKEGKTIMHHSFSISDHSKIKPNFSNPNIHFFNAKTGDASRFNHYFIDKNKCTVANYSTVPNPYYNVDIEGLTNICPGGAALLRAKVPSSGWTFKWYTGFDGINWTLVGQKDNLSVYHSDPRIRLLRIKLVATTPNGSKSYTRFHNIFVVHNGNVPCLKKALVKPYKDSLSINVQVFPNPTDNGIAKLKFDEIPLDLIVDVYDMNLMIVRKFKNKNFEKNKEIEINLNDLESGLYFIKVTTNKMEKIFKIVHQ